MYSIGCLRGRDNQSLPSLYQKEGAAHLALLHELFARLPNFPLEVLRHLLFGFVLTYY